MILTEYDTNGIHITVHVTQTVLSEEQLKRWSEELGGAKVY